MSDPQSWLSRLRAQSIWRHPALPILILVLLNCLVAGFVFDDYGESWDENSIYIYADNTLEAYRRAFTSEEMSPALYEPFNLRFYGPAYFAFSALFARGGHALFPNVATIHFWHLSYFLAFQISLVAFYALARRWVSTGAALGATLLFNLQPLLWGHAFINPKDIPFLALFLASVSLGLWMVDCLDARPATAADPAIPLPSFRQLWRDSLPAGRRRLRRLALALGLLTVLILVFPLVSVAESWARGAQLAGEGSPSFTLLGRLAPQFGAIPLDTYLAKLALLVPRFKASLIVLLLVGGLFLAARWLPGATQTARARQQVWWHTNFHPALIPAALTLGIAGALRVLAPAAGGLVALYLLQRLRRRGLPLLLAYGLLAGLVTLALWPFLWEAPLGNLLASLREMANFPKDISVLFAGQFMRSIDLPASYLPALIAIQLTVPALLLALAGSGIALWRWRRGDLKRPFLLALVAAWFLLPFLAEVIVQPTLYDNFRQLLFILPPLFLLAALALDFARARLPQWTYLALLALTLLPGLVGIVQLHPYEYVYYNGLVGGVPGVEGRFELDYWATSYREAIEYLNEVAPPDAAVYLHGPDHTIRRFGRPDLVAVYEVASQQTDLSVYDYAVLTTRFDTDKTLFPEGDVIASFGRQGATFVVVKALRP